MDQSVIPSIACHLEKEPDVVMAFAFGSRMTETATSESDLDVAVYFKPRNPPLDLEDEGEFPLEDVIWNELERMAAVPVDLVVLNRAPATLAHSILSRGKSLVIKDRSLYWRFFLAATSLAEDFRGFIDEYVQVKGRSHSLSEIDRSRLVRAVDFLETEMADFPEGFPRGVATRLASYARIRNVLAYEYLDMRFKRLKAFLDDSASDYQALIHYVETRYTDAVSYEGWPGDRARDY